jgi:hypothetical protein
MTDWFNDFQTFFYVFYRPVVFVGAMSLVATSVVVALFTMLKVVISHLGRG